MLPCNPSLMACFADINVSQGSVATYARCDGIFNIHLNINLSRNLPVKKLKSVKIWQNYGHESWPHFFGPPCVASFYDWLDLWPWRWRRWCCLRAPAAHAVNSVSPYCPVPGIRWGAWSIDIDILFIHVYKWNKTIIHCRVHLCIDQPAFVYSEINDLFHLIRFVYEKGSWNA